jgi:hypothetical protein
MAYNAEVVGRESPVHRRTQNRLDAVPLHALVVTAKLKRSN